MKFWEISWIIGQNQIKKNSTQSLAFIEHNFWLRQPNNKSILNIFYLEDL